MIMTEIDLSIKIVTFVMVGLTPKSQFSHCFYVFPDELKLHYYLLGRAGVSSWAGSEDTQAKMWAVTCDMLDIGTFGQ